MTNKKGLTMKKLLRIKRQLDHNEARPMTTGEVARQLFVHIRTVLSWVQQGKLKAYRTPGQHCRITKEEFERFCKAYNMPTRGNL